MITLGRWLAFSKRDQLAHIASEIFRAKLAENKDVRKAVLERAIDLINFSLSDQKWRDNPLLLLFLRNELANAYINKKKSLEKILAAI